MERWQLRPGMLVMHRKPEDSEKTLARVEKVNPKWTIVQHEDGSRYNASPAGLTEASMDATFDIEEATGLELGDPVRFIDGRITDDSVYVVLDVKGMTYKLARLRGSGNRFYRSVAGSSIALVPEGEVTV